jgi:hypothetical protein
VCSTVAFNQEGDSGSSQSQETAVRQCSTGTGAAAGLDEQPQSPQSVELGSSVFDCGDSSRPGVEATGLRSQRLKRMLGPFTDALARDGWRRPVPVVTNYSR